MNTNVQTLRLSEIAELNPRLTKSLESNELVSFLRMAAVTAETASTTTGEEKFYREVSKGYTPFIDGDILIAKITPCFENGKIAQAKLRHRIGFGSTEFHIVRPHPSKAEARYLLHFLRQEYIRHDGARKMTGSAGQRRVPEHFLANLEILLPPLEEQKRIAEILDRAEELRSKRKEAIAKLDTLTQAIFLEMFGDPVTNPKGWKIKIGKSICSRITVGIVVQPASYYQDNGVPALRSQNIKQNSISTDNLVFFSPSDNETKLAKTRVKAGDVVLVRTGQPGTAAVIPGVVQSMVTLYKKFFGLIRTFVLRG